MMKNNIIDYFDTGIVAQEVEITISDEKLKNILFRTYEKAQRREKTISFCDWCGVFLSISGTLLITILTASFNSIGTLSADIVRNIFIIICVSCAVLGFILLYYKYKKGVNNNNQYRDSDVEEIMNSYLSTDNGK